MGEDKLSHRQRIRLEALSQTQNFVHNHFDSKPTTQEIFRKAEEIERWLIAADRELN